MAVQSGAAGYNPLLGNLAGNNAFGFNPFYNGYNPSLNNIAGQSAFYSGAQSPASVEAGFANNPLVNSRFGNNFAGPVNNFDTAFTNPRLGNILGNNFVGSNSAGQVPSYNPLISNPAGPNVLGFNPALNGFNYPYAAQYVNGLPGLGGIGSPYGLGLGQFYPNGNLGAGNNVLNQNGLFGPGQSNADVLGPAPYGVSRSANGGFFPNYAQSIPGLVGPTAFGSGGIATNPVTYNPFLSFSNYSYGLPHSVYGYETNGYGSFYSPYASSMTQYWMNSLYANRYNYRNGSLLSPYAAASFYGPIAQLIAAANSKENSDELGRARFPARIRDTERVPFRRAEPRADRSAHLLPRDQVIDETGSVRWPESAPESDSDLAQAKARATQAVKQAAAEQDRTGRAKVGHVVDARNKVDNYANLAMAQARGDGGNTADQLSTFFASLDRALVHMTQVPASMAAVTNITPESAPTTAGEVLKGALQEKKAGETKAAAGQGIEPRTAPTSAGDVLKQAQPKRD